jgi:dolichol-phosphate mannosyltransferase
MLASAAPFLAVMDADLQHDETLLPQMLAALKNDDLDIVIGSRYAADGSLGDWDHARAAMSRIAARFSKLVVPADLTDPMSGFFMIRRATLHQVVRRLSRIGFKILVDVFASSPQPLRFKELPYQFRARHAGDSKLDSQVVWEYLMLLLDKFVGHIVPVRFLWFACVGALGVLVHVLTVMLLLNMGKMSFVPSQAIATFVSMISNFAVNNILTYRDLRLRGWRWMRGLVSFVLACSVGALANVGVAAYLFFHHEGWIVSAISGILVSSVWNYAVTSLYTWNAPSG